MRRSVGQGTVKLTGLMPIRNRDGTTRWYYRAKGSPLTRLPDLPHDDPSFLTAYAAARSTAAKAGAKPGPGTIGAAVVVALQSADYTSASMGYRKHLRPHLEAIRKAGGGAMVKDLRPGHIERDLATLTPHVARARLKAWRMICKQVRWSEYRITDPAAAVSPPKAPATEGHRPWTADEIAAFRTRWPVGTVARARMELLHWTGCRVSDAVRIGPGMIDRDGVLVFRQQKTGGLAYVPWSAPLPDYAAGMISDRQIMHDALICLAGHMTFLPTVHGGRRSEKAISNDVSADARAAGLTGCTAHGLRKSRAVALAESGATAHQIGAWTGHETLVEVAHYTKAADRKKAVMGTIRERQSATPADPVATLAK